MRAFPGQRPYVIAKAGDAVHGGHFEDEGEEVVDEGVDALVDQGLPGKVRDRLEAIVDVELGRHRHEAERLRVKKRRVSTRVRLVSAETSRK